MKTICFFTGLLRFQPLTTVGISQHWDDGELPVSALRSQEVPLFPKFFQRQADLYLPLFQQPLLDLVQRLTWKDQRRYIIISQQYSFLLITDTNIWLRNTATVGAPNAHFLFCK